MRRIDELSERFNKETEIIHESIRVKNTITKIDYWGLATENVKNH